MRSEEARLGMRVRVRESYTDPGFQGAVGTIAAKWGAPDYVALDVLLDDGRSALFWHHQLEEYEEGGHRKV